MTGPRDPFERLRQADPARTREPALPTSDSAEEMYRAIVNSDSRRRYLPRRWMRVALAVAAAITMAAAAYLLTRPVTEPLTIGCYSSATLDADLAVIPADVDVSPSELCRAVWQSGGEFAAETGGEPPSLTACVLDTGTIGVFPSLESGSVCETLGLGRSDQPADDDTRSILELQEALVSRFLDKCLDQPSAAAIVEGEFTRSGLSGWQVISRQPFTSERPCASLAIDPVSLTVELVPVSP